MALPPPPPERFWKETFSTMSDLTSTSPVPRAVISQPPPAPPGIRKWIFSTSAAKAWKENEAAMMDAASVGLSTFNMFHVPYVGDSLVLKSLIICSPSKVG